MCRYQIFAIRHHTRDAPKANSSTYSHAPSRTHHPPSVQLLLLNTLIVQNNMSSHTTPAHIPPSIPSHMQPGIHKSYPPPNVTSSLYVRYSTCASADPSRMESTRFILSFHAAGRTPPVVKFSNLDESENITSQQVSKHYTMNYIYCRPHKAVATSATGYNTQPAIRLYNYHHHIRRPHVGGGGGS